MLWSLLFSLACGGGSPKVPSRSVPTEPTVDLAQPELEEPVFMELAGLFVVGPMQLPVPLMEAEIGMSEARVKAAHAVVASSEMPRTENEVAGRQIYGGSLAGYHDIRFTFIVEAGRLTAIDLSMPAQAAMPVLQDHWGEPDTSGVDDQGRPRARWSSADGIASLVEVEGRAIIKFTAPASP